MIRLENVCKTYFLGGETVRAVDHVSLDIDEHEYISVIGASGSGKSTLMNIIGCLDTADEGTYYLRGKEVSDYTNRQMASLRNREIGFVFQQFNLIQKLTAYENVELPLIYQGIGHTKRHSMAMDALDRVGLTDRMHHRPNQLSGGQQQRVAVARALSAHPSLILADEPTGNLDSKTGEEIMRLFDELHEAGNTILLITHDTRTASRTQRIVRLVDGKIVSDKKNDLSQKNGSADRERNA
ncbi:MAG: ABC transporter ATP-binding protein [Clostridiales bacterium]|nr:ABC transporter ATP-binding protein [Clostridiales bacterium]